jgi:hypothetical protein
MDNKAAAKGRIREVNFMGCALKNKSAMAGQHAHQQAITVNPVVLQGGCNMQTC